MHQEKRQFHRITFEAPVYLHWENRNWPSTLVDISLNGLLIEKPDDWRDDMYGEFFDIEIILEDTSKKIRMNAHVAHEHEARIGFQCDYIDLESMTTLKRLVEFNSESEDLLERELDRLIA